MKPPLLKDTLLMPQTSFPMRANLAQKEPELVELWDQKKIYHKIIEQNEKGELYSLVDGPIYANGALHIGHCLNRVLKDIVVKYKNMKGFLCEFVPGWDCHGLPIELATSKKLGKEAQKLSPTEFRNACRKEACFWQKNQETEFKRLGTLARWDEPYLTLHPEYEAEEVRLIKKIFKNGFLFQGKKPVNWSPSLGTALASSEIIYQDVKSPAIYVLFKLSSSDPRFQENTFFVIWTTTPWTLPANTGICLGADFEYGVFEDSKTQNHFILATKLCSSLEKKWDLKLKKIKSFQGSELEGLKASHPFLKRESLVVLGSHVSLEAGTGCVHTAPGHGLDDYYVGLKYKLDSPCPVNSYGKFTDEVKEFEGLTVWKANPLILDKLQKSNHLLHHEEITHSYPHDERTKKPTIFRLTSQWFVAVESQDQKLKKQALRVAREDVNFIPSWGEGRFTSMLENNPDWCVSRQRLWGVPLPIFYCTQCETPLVEEKLIDKIADEIEKHPEGSNVFYEKEPSFWTEGYSCSHCKNKTFTASTDILDVWFDSASCHAAVQMKRKNMTFPASLYLEGSDQHRGWFQTSFLASLAAHGQAPFKNVLTHGFVNDDKGLKMSKSRGNVVVPQKVIGEYGAEILRLWASHEDYSRDVTVGKDIFKRLSESYRKIRNTVRFMLGNLHDFNEEKDSLEFENLLPLDKWILIKLNHLIKDMNKYYDNFQFHKGYHRLGEFFSVTLSSFYLDILKDRLYTSAQNSHKRRSCQTAISHLIRELTILMSPVLSFTAEEIYQSQSKNKESVFLEKFSNPNKSWEDSELEEKFQKILEVRALSTHSLENLRNEKKIGSSLEAEVCIQATSEYYNVLKEFEDHIKEIFIVSEITFNKVEKIDTEGESKFLVTVKKFNGKKCSRCWKFYRELIKHESYEEEVCEDCKEAIG